MIEIEQQGIELLKSAGFEVEVLGGYFQVRKNTINFLGLKQSILLTDVQYLVTDIIMEYAYREGLKDGENRVRNALNKILNP